MRGLAVRAFIPQLCLVLLLCAGLTGLLGSAIVWHRVWIGPPPLSAQLPGPASVNNSPALQQQIARHHMAKRKQRGIYRESR